MEFSYQTSLLTVELFLFVAYKSLSCFIVNNKLGRENLLAYFLSRLNEETTELYKEEENDFHDQLVASIEYIDAKNLILKQ